jgi:hypothetical protein
MAERRRTEEMRERKQREINASSARFRESLNLLKQAGTSCISYFPDLPSWMRTFWTSPDQQISADASRFTNQHGTEILDFMFARAPAKVLEWTQTALGDSIRKEGARLVEVLAPSGTTLSQVLSDFSLDDITERIKGVAPLLYLTLSLAIKQN